MLKKIAGSTLVLVALSGCGHHQRWVGPAVVGGAIGYSMAQPRVIVVPDYSVCQQWYYNEREACFRGVEARSRQDQARREQEAYRQGYGR